MPFPKLIILLSLMIGALGCQTMPEMRTLTVRYSPDQDVRKEIELLAKKENLKAAALVAAVGSLKQVALRYADKKEATVLKGAYEITSLSGHVSIHGLHLHMAVADAKGQMIGGHLMEGNVVRTTLELTLVENSQLEFFREDDASTGYKELQVKNRLR